MRPDIKDLRACPEVGGTVAFPAGSSPYPFGVDPYWHGTKVGGCMQTRPYCVVVGCGRFCLFGGRGGKVDQERLTGMYRRCSKASAYPKVHGAVKLRARQLHPHPPLAYCRGNAC